MAATQTHDVCSVEDLPPGGVVLADVGPYGVAVYNVNGEFHALNNRCPHMGAPMCRGRISGMATENPDGTWGWTREGEIVECPWHGWKFAIADGRSLTKPVQRIRRFVVRVIDDRVVLETDER